MNPLLPAEKLTRFNEVVNSQNDNKLFADKMYDRVKDAESILVKDPTGLKLHYFPKFENETDVQAYARRPIAIPKAFIEKFDEDTVKNHTGDTEVDLDSVEHLKAQVKAYIDENVLGGVSEYTTEDIIRVVSSHGTPTAPKFIYEIAKNGRLDASIPFSQKRFSSVRENIAKTAADLGLTEIVVTSLNLETVRDQLVALFSPDGGEPEVDPEPTENKKVLFGSDIILPMTHLKDKQTYIAEISQNSFDYFGQVFFKVELEEEVVVNPDLTITQADEDPNAAAGINAKIALTNGPAQLEGRIYYRLASSTGEFQFQTFTINNGDIVNVPVAGGDDYETYVWLNLNGEEQVSERTTVTAKGEVIEPVVSRLKFSGTNTWTNEDERYFYSLNPGYQIYLLFNVTGVTESFDAKLLEVVPEGETASNLFASIEGLITVKPGLNVIPFTAPTLPETQNNRLLALVNKETVVFGDANQTNMFATSKGITLNIPAITMPAPTVTLDHETIAVETVKTDGITATWSNVSESIVTTKELNWTASGGGGTELTKVDIYDHTIVNVKAPYAIAGNVITVKLVTDGGEVSKTVTVIDRRDVT